MLDGEIRAIEDNKEVYKHLSLMDELCDILMEKREKKGSIDLDVKESEIFVDNKGKINVVASHQNKAQKIIEEFMILANVTVAEYFYFLDIPFVYRVHEKPNEDKLENFYKFLDSLGVKYKKKRDEVYSKDFQLILKSVEYSKNYTLINRVMLRSMSKAKYSDENIGHYGIASKRYAHFTSPIRRYPDLQIHRIIKDQIRGRMKKEKIAHYDQILVDVADHSSKMERRADEAERETDKLKKAQYMENHIGEEFDGVVSGVTEWGIYVELPNTVEGMIHISKLPGDYFVYDEKTYEVKGTHHGLKYVLGQPVHIRVEGVDSFLRTVDFSIV